MLDSVIKINGRKLGENEKPYFIAEAGSNFNQDMDTAKRLIDAAANAGADAVKFQLFQADVMQTPGTELHKVFKSTELCPEWVPVLSNHAESAGITFLASPFDTLMVDVLKAAGAPALKVASSETTNLRLLDYMARLNLPLLVSTGMCDDIDIMEAVNTCVRSGNRQIALLQCTSIYPLPEAQVHLKVMDQLRRRYGCVVGYSDHALGLTSCIAAAARGAQIIEKHFTLDRSSEGPDHFYSLEPNELKELVIQIGVVYDMLGMEEKALQPDEKKYGRRIGLVATQDILAGMQITDDMLATSRPALGIRERYRSYIRGYKAQRDICAGEAIQWTDIQP